MLFIKIYFGKRALWRMKMNWFWNIACRFAYQEICHHVWLLSVPVNVTGTAWMLHCWYWYVIAGICQPNVCLNRLARQCCLSADVCHLLLICSTVYNLVSSISFLQYVKGIAIAYNTYYNIFYIKMISVTYRNISRVMQLRCHVWCADFTSLLHDIWV